MSEELKTAQTTNSSNITQSEIEKEIIFLKQTVNQLAINYEKAVMEIIKLKKDNEELLKIKKERDCCYEKIAELEKALSEEQNKEKQQEPYKAEAEEEPELTLVSAGANPVAKIRRLSEAELEIKTKENLLESKNAQISLPEKELSLINKELEEQKKINKEIAKELELALERENERFEKQKMDAGIIDAKRIEAEIQKKKQEEQEEQERAEEIWNENNVPRSKFPLDQDEIDAGIVVSENLDLKKYQEIIIVIEAQLYEKIELIAKMETDFTSEKEKTSAKLSAKIKEFDIKIGGEFEKNANLSKEKTVLEKQVEALKTELAAAIAAQKTNEIVKREVTATSTATLNNKTISNIMETTSNTNTIKASEELNKPSAKPNLADPSTFSIPNYAGNFGININTQEVNKALSSSAYGQNSSTSNATSSTFFPASYTNYTGSSNQYTLPNSISNTTANGFAYLSQGDYSKKDALANNSNSNINNFSSNNSTLINGFAKTLLKDFTSGSFSSNKYVSSVDFSSNYQNSLNNAASSQAGSYSNFSGNQTTSNAYAKPSMSASTDNYNNTYHTGLINQNTSGQTSYPGNSTSASATSATGSNTIAYTNYNLNDNGKNSYLNSNTNANNSANANFLISASNSTSDLQKKVALETDEIIARVLKGGNTSSNANVSNYSNYSGINFAGQAKTSNEIIRNKSVYEAVNSGNDYRSGVTESQTNYQNSSLNKSNLN
jgi:hypothetical protein